CLEERTRNEYFRKVPFAWRNVRGTSTSERFLLPGGTYEERVLPKGSFCLEERTRNEYFRKVPLPGGTYEERVLPKGSFSEKNHGLLK
ncbi:hypothetical protein F5144DRAFT_470863, partial [Chaetomium tenue]